MVFGWLFGRNGARNDQACGDLIEQDGGVYAFGGKKYYSLVHDPTEGHCIRDVRRLDHGVRRQPRTLSEAALVEYAQVEKCLEEAYSQPNAGWIVSLLDGLARLRDVTKLLCLRTEQVYQDTQQWYHTRLHSPYHVIVCLWRDRSGKHEALLNLDEQRRRLGLFYHWDNQWFVVDNSVEAPQFPLSDCSPTSFEEVLSFLSIIDKNADSKKQRLKGFDAVFLGNLKRALAEQIGLARIAEQDSRTMQQFKLEHQELKNHVRHLEASRSAVADENSDLKEENARLNGERESLRKELASFRISAGRAARGDNKNVADGSASRFPSMSDVLSNWRQAGKDFSEFYDNLDLHDEVKVRFAESTRHVLKRMYCTMDKLYKERLEAMLQSLGDLETVLTLTRSTEDAFNVYCRRHWEELFVKFDPVCVAPPLQEKGSALVEENRRSEVTGCAQSQGAPGTMQVDRRIRANEQMLDAKKIPQGEQENAGSTRNPGTTPFVYLSDLVAEFLERLGEENVSGDGEKKEGLQEHLKSLWRTTVAMYLQRPVLRPDFDSSVQVPFSSNQHDHVYKAPRKHEIVLLVVPAPLKAPNGFSVFSSASNSMDFGWVSVDKGHVDTLRDD
ncbi:hypothetical protein BSKO_01784 [Bryopsis sp. KO-2023]|nr:hypothetical protein BSKO_01784 [Bryopsis sp. KO-2023]